MGDPRARLAHTAGRLSGKHTQEAEEPGGLRGEPAWGPRRREGARLGEAGRQAPGDPERSGPDWGRAGLPAGGGRRRPRRGGSERGGRGRRQWGGGRS